MTWITSSAPRPRGPFSFLDFGLLQTLSIDSSKYFPPGPISLPIFLVISTSTSTPPSVLASAPPPLFTPAPPPFLTSTSSLLAAASSLFTPTSLSLPTPASSFFTPAPPLLAAAAAPRHSFSESHNLLIDFRQDLSSLAQKPPTPVLGGETFWENLLLNIFYVINTA